MAHITTLITPLALRFARRGDRGASLVEYALLLALIALVCVAAVGVMGGTVNSKFSTAGTSMFGP